MGYVEITRSFHGSSDEHPSFRGLGASSGNDIDYYASASELRWRNNDWRALHNDLVALDGDWRDMLDAMSGASIPGVPQELRDAIQIFSHYPMPIVADMALFFEVIGGQRPLDQTCVSVLRFARERLLGAAGGMAALASTAGIIGGIAALAPADFGITAASAGSIAGLSAVSSGVLTGLGMIADSLSQGKAPSKQSLELVAGGAAAIVGGDAPSQQAQDSARAAIAQRAQQDRDSFRESATERLARLSVQKRDACRSRGGIFDPRAPDSCRIVDPKRVNEKLQSAGIDTGVDVKGKTSVLVPLGLAALGVAGVWLAWPKKPARSNPKPKKRRRRRQR